MGKEAVDADILGMSDDDFLNAPIPVVEPALQAQTETTEQSQEVTPEQQTQQVEKTAEELATEQAATTQEEEGGQQGEGEQEIEPEKKEGEGDPSSTGSAEEQAAAQAQAEKDKQATTTPVEKTAQEQAKEHESFYKAVMGEFQANGKKIALKSPEEAIKLMQMGANYTAKMQQLAPHRRVLMMLENNGLLDEGKLSYLIDIDKKNPDAIRKLIQDSKINPLDIDVDAPNEYKAGNHTVSDKVVNFRSSIDDLSTSDTGRETLNQINKWDQASKELLLDDPAVVGVIHEQRSNGIYDRIASEVDRQRMLGTIGADVPFLRAYLHVGNALQAQNGFADLVGGQKQQVQTSAPVAVRPAVRQPAVTASEKAKAAATSAPSARQARTQVNPLAMSDDDFLKSFENRV